MADVDFEFGPVPDAPAVDVIERRPAPRVAITLAVVVLAGLALFVILLNRPQSTAVTKQPSPVVTPTSSVAQAALAQVVVLAESADKLPNDYLSDRELVCPRLPAGLAAPTSVLAAALPGFTIAESATTRGANGTTCGLQLKARDALGATVIMTILAPPEANTSTFEISHGNDRSTVVVVGVIDQGWSVQVGWVGQTGDALAASQLEAAAHDSRLLW